MTAETIRVLLVEHNPGEAKLVGETLLHVPGVTMQGVARLVDALDSLQRCGADLVLLDLSLPDSAGLETIRRLSQCAPHIPIIALSGPNDSHQMRDAIKFGAEDYLVKGSFTADLLERSIRYAIDRRRAREELAEARDSALESARLRGEFLANMSHEIRTPLNGVVGMTRLLMDTPLNGEQREMIDIAQQSAGALLKIVNDVLDFSKISAGKVALEEADFDLGTAVESVIALFAEQAQRKAIELASYVESEVPVALRGDAARLCQVLMNLVGNAVKFTPEGEVTLRVGLVAEAENAVTLRFAVKDTGIGIPLQGQRHLFQAFAQADGSTTRKYGGTGLGLAICAQLVELMGGNIGVQSETHAGSLFWFTACFRKQPAATSARSLTQTRLKPARMLVSDHSVAAARIACEHAEALGIECQLATSPAETMVALKSAAAAGTPFDIALIEIQNIANNGLALGRAIKQDAALSHTRVLGMYSLGTRPEESQVHAAGIRALLVKPIKQSQLFNTLSIMLASIAESAAARGDQGNGRRKRVRELKSRLPEEMRRSVALLLVEDNPVNQQVQLRMLERIGYHADAVDNGREALEALARKRYQIVLMDCQMPEMDGYAATREIRRREGDQRSIIIVGVTAHALADDRDECLNAGMDDYVSKPIVPEDLALTIEKWVMHISEKSPSKNGAGADRDLASGEVLDREVLAELRECQRPDESDFVERLIAIFLNDLARQLDQIRRAAAHGDIEALRHAAHALKGAAGEIGALRIASICGRLERDVTVASPATPAELEEVLQRVELEASQLKKMLRIQTSQL